MIKQADQVKYVSDVAANMNLRLATSKDVILNSSKVYEERNLTTLHATVAQIVTRLDNFSKKK